jgi:chaperonin GroES
MGDRILIQPLERDDVTTGGIFLPDTAKEKPQEGEVKAVGPGRVAEDGKRVPLELKVGEVVLYSKYAGTEVKDDGVDYLILSERDILAKISS